MANIFSCIRNQEELDKAYQDKLEFASRYENTNTQEMYLMRVREDYENQCDHIISVST